MRSGYTRALIFVAVFLCTAGFDQGTKEWARTLPQGERVSVIDGVWDWELAMNTGIAFSMFDDIPYRQVILSLFALAVLVGICVMALRSRPEERRRRIALALIAGGALGNLIDRVRDGAVTDFIRWRAGEHLWPVFNVADAALLIGVVLLILSPAAKSVHKLQT